MKAIWKGTVLAESAQTKVVEGNHYFPPEAVDKQYLTESQTHTRCGWKGIASYYDVRVNGDTLPDAAWYYPDCKDEAKHIEGYVAFSRQVDLSD